MNMKLSVQLMAPPSFCDPIGSGESFKVGFSKSVNTLFYNIYDANGSIFQSMNSTITMNLSVIFHLKGINFTISGACAIGSHAIGMAYMLIKSGLQGIKYIG